MGTNYIQQPHEATDKTLCIPLRIWNRESIILRLHVIPKKTYIDLQDCFAYTAHTLTTTDASAIRRQRRGNPWSVAGCGTPGSLTWIRYNAHLTRLSLMNRQLITEMPNNILVLIVAAGLNEEKRRGGGGCQWRLGI